ncbi:c-type cytochrome [Legionella londiniensis]|uniref:Cytochrome c5 n=1 Tax=Legionella londiniensis TaxID=45068 RepID=A0A0W0VNP6_9GAMM|nr:c-type cytochrome [Legionella londiniensis]KTD21748.1 cytochrome c5 [Legionella londiniensis]STX93415.1 cytochrome c5 [Legionella londiniensis]
MQLTKWAIAGMYFLSLNAIAASHHPQDFLKSVTGSQHEGAEIAQHFCSNCHSENPPIPLGAPRIGIEADWQHRIKQGFSVLFKHTDEGLNAMPPRGGCFECSDQQLVLAILALLPEKEQKRLNKELKVSN